MQGQRGLRCLVTVLGLFAGLAGVGAGAEEQQPAAAQASATDAQYRLSVGDKLHVVVFGQDDVSGDFQIDGAGNITMPLLGQVHVASRTLTEVQTEITTDLDRDYIVNPKVSIEVLNYRPFYILGQVASPGSYPYVTGMDVRQAVAIAGGFTPRARTSTVMVIWQSAQGSTTKIEATPDVPVFPGDTIEVQRRLF